MANEKRATRGSHLLDRRSFLAIGALAPWTPPGFGAAGDAPPALRLDYRIQSPPPLPPPLEIDPPARATVGFQGTGDQAQCWLGLRVTCNGEPGLLPLALWIGNWQQYWNAREALRLPAFRGSVAWDGEIWRLSVDGRQEFSARPAAPEADGGAGASRLPWYTYSFALSPDWTAGPLAEGVPQLWRLQPRSAEASRRLDPAACHVTGGLGGWLAELGASGPIAATADSGSLDWQTEFVQTLEASSLEPFAFRSYSPGALQLVPRETQFVPPPGLEEYRRRPHLFQTGLAVVSVDAFGGSQATQRLLPPPCEPIPSASIRAVAIRGLDDPRQDEAWLLVECALQGRRVWYALSHLRPSVAAAAFGREVFGYPTKDGTVTAMIGGNRFGSGVSRRGVSLFRADGFYGGFSTGTSLAEMNVATLRLRPATRNRTAFGEIVTQSWYFQGLRQPANPASLDASFPAGEGGEIWNQVGPIRPYAALVLDGAAMQRRPGRVVAEVKDIAPYYRDRCDGRLPWENLGAAAQAESSD